jgi:hypothetical protein
MLHRSVVVSNINKLTRCYKFLGVESPIKENCIKLIMLLSTHIDRRKITIREKKRYVTEFYLKFNIIASGSYVDRILVIYSRIPYTRIDNNLIGASIITLSEVIKKCN